MIGSISRWLRWGAIVTLIVAAIVLASRPAESFARASGAIEKLAGNWSWDQVDADGAVLNGGTTPWRTHYRFEIRRKDVLAFQVADQDWAPGQILKGDESLKFTFQLDGRRINGKFLATRKQSLSIQGIVNENLDEIQFQYQLPAPVRCDGRPCTIMLRFKRTGDARGARPPFAPL